MLKKIVKKPNRSSISEYVTPPLSDIAPKLPGKKGRPNGSFKYEMKLSREDYHEFTAKDWITYFQSKAKQFSPGEYKEHKYARKIIAKLMKDYSPKDVKNMIDFVFSDAQDKVDRRVVNMGILSQDWLNYIYNSSILWREGTLTKQTVREHMPKRDYSQTRITFGD